MAPEGPEPRTPPPSPRGGMDGGGARSWTSLPRPPHAAVPLTAAEPRAPDPPGFAGRLWPPQATLLQAMLDLEAQGGVALEGGRWLAAEGGRIAAEFSFGKTVLCVALACAAPLPRPRPRPQNFVAMDRGAVPEARREKRGEPADRRGLGPNCLAVAAGPAGREAQRGYTFRASGRGAFPALSLHYRRTYPATLVVAAPSVITQWEDAIRRFAPALSARTIENVRSLREFHRSFAESAPHDLVLLKAGKVSTSFRAPGEAAAEGRQRPLTAALAAALDGWEWGRLIVDDFDTIRLATDDVFLPARFTWVISATSRSTNTRQDLVSAASPAAFLRANARLALLGAALDGVLNSDLRLQCSPSYVQAHINSTVAHFRRVVVPGGKAVGILHDLGIPPEVLEMAAAGALETAAEQLNIRVASMRDLVEKVLEARVGKYRWAVRVLTRVAAARAAVAAGGESSSPIAPADLRNALKHGDDAAAEKATAAAVASKPLDAALLSLEEWAEKEKEEHGGRLRRMRDNLREGCCPACSVPFEDDGYVLTCCQVVICGYCAFFREKGGKCRFVSRCPHCAADVDPRSSFLYVCRDLDLAGGLPDDADLFSGGPEPPAEAAPPGPSEADGDPRLRALVQLLRGENPAAACDDQKGLPPFVHGLLAGVRDLPRPPGVPPKFLVFAMHAESSRQILAALAAEGIAAIRLAGKRAEKTAAVSRFTAPGEAAVLVATSSRDCAGLHLPEVSTVIFYNRHYDREIVKQAIGRAQRVGRAYSLEVVEIVSEGELRLLGAGDRT